MGADISRQRFNPANDYLGVLMQQGRVQLDADWNELVELIDRRFRAETVDIIGRAVVPLETPDGFKISLAAGKMTIGPGRMYVHGYLTENHVTPPFSFDPILSELRGAAVPYEQQPYFPSPPGPPALPTVAGPHLVYLDVWQREITYVEQPDVVEIAVGVDTTTRLQTAWQVKILPNVGAGVTCSTPDDKIPGWLAEISPSAGRLTTSALGVAAEVDPCLIPPSGGYRGLDNRTYRVEIHDKATTGKPATFKWSRDNGSVVTPVNTINAARTVLGVVRTQRDDILRFSTGDWVEITDDNRELNGLPGEIRKIADVNDATKTITLATPLTAALFPTDAQDQVTPARHTRVRRWDQRGLVRDSAGNTLQDLDAASSTGVISVPASGATVLLEDGVAIKLELDPTTGSFRSGDYWIFTARTADASVEALVKAPPRGIHHHYARLGVVTFPGTVIDCRTLWPPAMGGSDCCDCTICVSPEQHQANSPSIQMAIDRVISAGGGKVCLEVGDYVLGTEPLLIAGAKSLQLVGKGWQTVLISSSTSASILVDKSRDVALEDFTLRFPPGQDTQRPDATTIVGLLLHNSLGVRVERCDVHQLDVQAAGGLAIGLAGLLLQVSLRDNLLAASGGIGSLSLPSLDDTPRILVLETGKYLRTSELRIEGNILRCDQTGIRLDGLSILSGATRIDRNTIRAATDAGIVVIALVEPGGNVDITDNELNVTGDGIRAGADPIAILNNTIIGEKNQDGPTGTGSGLVIVPTLDPKSSLRIQLIGNSISNMGQHGIVLAASILGAMIKQNRIETVLGGGIIMSSAGSADTLSIANNHIINIGLRAGRLPVPLAGIMLFMTREAEVSDNSIRSVGLQSRGLQAYFGIYILACRTAIVSRNEVTDVGPDGDFKGTKVGIRVDATFDDMDISGNIIRRSPRARDAPLVSYAALVIQGDMDFDLANIGFLTGSDTQMVGYFDNRLVKLPRGKENTSVRGNRLNGRINQDSIVRTVQINIQGQCVFLDNQVLREVF